MSKNGKGSSPRNCFSEQYRINYDRIFKKKSVKLKRISNVRKRKK